MTNAQMTNDETKTRPIRVLFRHLIIRHSDIDSSFEFRLSSLVIVAILFLLAGCEKTGTSTTPARPVVPAGQCVITGIVKFSAPRPRLTSIDVQCCGAPATIPDESAIINDKCA